MRISVASISKQMADLPEVWEAARRAHDPRAALFVLKNLAVGPHSGCPTPTPCPMPPLPYPTALALGGHGAPATLTHTAHTARWMARRDAGAHRLTTASPPPACRPVAVVRRDMPPPLQNASPARGGRHRRTKRPCPVLGTLARNRCSAVTYW